MSDDDDDGIGWYFDPDDKATLSALEVRWRRRQPYLEQRGYMLRPRFRPGWRASWQDQSVPSWRTPEDSVRTLAPPFLIDATRIVDGRPVYIKRIDTASEELQIGLLLSRDEHDPSISYIVMPLLREFDRPPMQYTADLIDFVDQVLEGLVYMHELGVAHRDCAYNNLMMEGSSLFPYGHHPALKDTSPDLRSRAFYMTRLAADIPVKYYFIDFGISVRIPEGRRKLVLGVEGLDQEVPELSVKVPYDPFKVDVFILGNVFNKHILAKFVNVEFMQPLITAMKHEDPNARPDASQVLRQWQKMRQWIIIFRWGIRLHPKDEPLMQTIVLNGLAYLKLGMLLSRWFVAWTTRLVAAARSVF